MTLINFTKKKEAEYHNKYCLYVKARKENRSLCLIFRRELSREDEKNVRTYGIF